MLKLSLRIAYKVMSETKKQRIVLVRERSENSRSQDSFTQYRYAKTKLKPISNKISKVKLQKKEIADKPIEYHIQTLEQILAFRKDNEAPVDTMGCDQLYDKKADILTQKFQQLVSLMLSSQTTDEVTSSAVRGMITGGVLDPHIMCNMEEQKLLPFIKSVNFCNRKTSNLILAARSFVQKGYPKTYQQVIQFKGVGVKMATLYMKTAEGVDIGIGTDTHVHRIANRLQWVNTNHPDQTQIKLQQTFPKLYWKHINYALVGFGQILCHATRPKCKQCPVSDRCPAAVLNW